MRVVTTVLLSLAILALLVPSAAAHPRATIVESLSGERCYIYSNDTETPEFWRETNGILTGGVEGGSAADHLTGSSGGGSGLQRIAIGQIAPDTQLTAEEFSQICLT